MVRCCIDDTLMLPPLPLVQHMRKNQYEEALFRVEDDRFELDMMIETNASAMRTMANLARQLEVSIAPCPIADFYMPPIDHMPLTEPSAGFCRGLGCHSGPLLTQKAFF